MPVPPMPASAEVPMAAMPSPMAAMTVVTTSMVTATVMTASMTSAGHRLGWDNQRCRYCSDKRQFS